MWTRSKMWTVGSLRRTGTQKSVSQSHVFRVLDGHFIVLAQSFAPTGRAAVSPQHGDQKPH